MVQTNLTLSGLAELLLGAPPSAAGSALAAGLAVPAPGDAFARRLEDAAAALADGAAASGLTASLGAPGAGLPNDFRAPSGVPESGMTTAALDLPAASDDGRTAIPTGKGLPQRLPEDGNFLPTGEGPAISAALPLADAMTRFAAPAVEGTVASPPVATLATRGDAARASLAAQIDTAVDTVVDPVVGTRVPAEPEPADRTTLRRPAADAIVEPRPPGPTRGADAVRAATAAAPGVRSALGSGTGPALLLEARTPAPMPATADLAGTESSMPADGAKPAPGPLLAALDGRQGFDLRGPIPANTVTPPVATDARQPVNAVGNAMQPIAVPAAAAAAIERDVVATHPRGARAASVAAAARRASLDEDDGDAPERVVPGAADGRHTPGVTLSARPVIAPASTRDLAALAERIETMMHRGAGNARVHLNLGGLGDVEINVRMESRHAHVHFVVQDPALRDALEAQLPRLRSMLEDSGLSLGDVQTGLPGGSSGERDNARDALPRPRRGTRLAALEAAAPVALRGARGAAERLLDAFA